MTALPAMLKVEARRCIVIGGGEVALRRARTLHACGARVVVVAPRLHPEIAHLPVETRPRPFKEADVGGAFLAVVATDNPEVNDHAAEAARAVGALVNRADRPTEGDLTIPSHGRHGPLTVAVDSGGAGAAAAADVRHALESALPAEWPEFFTAATRWRRLIQHRFANETEERRHRLRALTGPTSRAHWREAGAAAWAEWAARLADPGHDPPST